MTKERLKELLPVMQAFVDGKAIQMRRGKDDTWTEIFEGGEPSWLDGFDYRAKPEPRVIYVAENEQDGRPTVTGNFAISKPHKSTSNGERYVRFIEDLTYKPNS